MKLSKLIDKIEKKYPLQIAEKWDNTGLLVGDSEKEIKKVLLCLDVSSKAIDRAIEIGADLIVSHHPLIFKSLKQIVFDDITSRKVLRLIEEKIAVYAMHTNLDSAIDGLNDYVWDKLQIDSKSIYVDETYNRPIRYYKLNESMDIVDLANIVKTKLNIDNVRIVNDEYYTSNMIRKVALTTGSGMDFLNEVKDKVDLFITADIKYHEALDSLEYGTSLMDIGHYESEIFCIDIISKFLQENTDVNVEVYKAESILKTI